MTFQNSDPNEQWMDMTIVGTIKRLMCLMKHLMMDIASLTKQPAVYIHFESTFLRTSGLISFCFPNQLILTTVLVLAQLVGVQLYLTFTSFLIGSNSPVSSIQPHCVTRSTGSAEVLIIYKQEFMIASIEGITVTSCGCA